MASKVHDFYWNILSVNSTDITIDDTYVRFKSGTINVEKQSVPIQDIVRVRKMSDVKWGIFNKGDIRVTIRGNKRDIIAKNVTRDTYDELMRRCF